jgi:hypothetical protein
MREKQSFFGIWTATEASEKEDSMVRANSSQDKINKLF